MKIPFHLLFILILASCGTPDPILNAFKRVNQSLDNSYRQLSSENAYTQIYSDILLKAQKNTALASRAMDLYNHLRPTIDLIEQIRDTLHQKDSAGENTMIATGLLVDTPIGDSLRSGIEQTAHLCEIALVDKKQLPTLQTSLHQIRQMTTPEGWPQYFTGTPTVGALTLLSYMKMQLIKATTITLKDIDIHLK